MKNVILSTTDEIPANYPHQVTYDNKVFAIQRVETKQGTFIGFMYRRSPHMLSHTVSDKDAFILTNKHGRAATYRWMGDAIVEWPL